MRIIQISSYYPPHLGGQENVVQDLARHLADAGQEVHVLTSAKGGKRGKAKEDGVAVQRLGGHEFGHAPVMPKFPWALFRAARSGSIIHLHVGQAFTPEIVWLISKLRGVPYVAELHIDFEPSGPAGILLPIYKRFILGPVLRSASAVIVLNKKTLQVVQKNYRVQKKSLIMSNGIDEAYFDLERAPLNDQPPKRLNLLFVGRLSKQKNLGILLKALAEDPRDIHLDVIGEGDQRTEIEELIKKYQLQDVVTLHGRLERADVLPFYANSDALVMPSLYEAQPLVLLEAMAARIPIIGTNVIGVAEHIWNIGIVVPPTSDGIRSGFDKFHELYPTLPEMVARGYIKAEKLRWSNLRKDYEALYNEVLTDAI